MPNIVKYSQDFQIIVGKPRDVKDALNPVLARQALADLLDSQMLGLEAV
jgi:hypothetical protein